MGLFRRRAVQVAIAGLALLLILGGFAYGYGKASATARSVSLSDVRLTSLNLLPDGSAVSVGINASVSNPTNEPVTLSGVRYEVLLNGTKRISYSQIRLTRQQSP